MLGPAPAARIATHPQQAVIRILIAALVAGAILIHLDLPLQHALGECPSLGLVIAYVPAAGLLLVWSLAISRGYVSADSLRLRIGIALVTDVFVAAGFTAFGGQYAPISLPVFLAIIVGYGWRFGSHYALAASALCTLAFAWARTHNPLFELGSVATLGYYLCFFATPIYILQVILSPVREPVRSMTQRPHVLSMLGNGQGTPGIMSAAVPLVDDGLVSELRESCAEPDAWRALVEHFEHEARMLLVAAGTAHDVDDVQARQHALHRLRGAAASIAASRLEQIAGALERSPGRTTDWRLAREALDATLEVLRAAP